MSKTAARVSAGMIVATLSSRIEGFARKFRIRVMIMGFALPEKFAACHKWHTTLRRQH